MIRIIVYDFENKEIATIENVNTISLNPLFNILYITTLTGDINNPYSLANITLKPGMWCKLEE